jgi:transposase InsO family protein
LYVWFVIDHGRRRLIHFNVTTNPSARWVIQQLREAFPHHSASHYLVYDNDSIFSAEVTAAIRSFGIDPVRTAYRSPWQNPIAERWVGACRRELLDHVIVFGEHHLRRLLGNYVATTTPSGSTPASATHRMIIQSSPGLPPLRGSSACPA